MGPSFTEIKRVQESASGPTPLTRRAQLSLPSSPSSEGPWPYQDIRAGTVLSPTHKPTCSVDGGLQIFVRNQVRLQKWKSNPPAGKPCRGAPWLTGTSPAGEHGRCPHLQGYMQNAPSGPTSQLPSSTFSWTCNLRIAPSLSLSLSLCSSTMFSFLPSGKWGVKISQDPQFKIKSDLFLSPSLLPNNHTCVKLMLYITKREASLEMVQSDNF